MSSSPSVITFYDVLEISSSATPAEIRSAFKKCVLKYHPDKLSVDRSNNQLLTKEQHDALMVTKFQNCVAAANCLLDPQAKARYDAFALGKQMIDIAGRISETCSLREDFEQSQGPEFDASGGVEDDEQYSALLYTRECRCGGTYSVIWTPVPTERGGDSDEGKSTKRKFATCDSCSLVVEVACDI